MWFLFLTSRLDGIKRFFALRLLLYLSSCAQGALVDKRYNQLQNDHLTAERPPLPNTAVARHYGRFLEMEKALQDFSSRLKSICLLKLAYICRHIVYPYCKRPFKFSTEEDNSIFHDGNIPSP
jgi:hypothetical protein